MSACQLTLIGIRQDSKAKRILWFFRPKEIITWEPFDLHLTFRNDSDQEFPGGKCTFEIRGPRAHKHYELEMSSIKPKEISTSVGKNFVIQETGYVGLTGLQVEDIEHKYVPCVNPDGTETRDPKINYPLLITNREEIYQKYAVVVAIFFSVLATILTIVNVLVAIFK